MDAATTVVMIIVIFTPLILFTLGKKRKAAKELEEDNDQAQARAYQEELTRQQAELARQQQEQNELIDRLRREAAEKQRQQEAEHNLAVDSVLQNIELNGIDSLVFPLASIYTCAKNERIYWAGKATALGTAGTLIVTNKKILFDCTNPELKDWSKTWRSISRLEMNGSSVVFNMNSGGKPLVVTPTPAEDLGLLANKRVLYCLCELARGQT